MNLLALRRGGWRWWRAPVMLQPPPPFRGLFSRLCVGIAGGCKVSVEGRHGCAQLALGADQLKTVVEDVRHFCAVEGTQIVHCGTIASQLSARGSSEFWRVQSTTVAGGECCRDKRISISAALSRFTWAARAHNQQISSSETNERCTDAASSSIMNVSLSTADSETKFRDDGRMRWMRATTHSDPAS